jgi:hypothetical protein
MKFFKCLPTMAGTGENLQVCHVALQSAARMFNRVPLPTGGYAVSSASAPSALTQLAKTGKMYSLFDFDDHFANVEDDWRNHPIGEEVKRLS